jgi:hypothetical protein
LYPQLHAYLPIGGALSKIADLTKDPFNAIEANAAQVSSLAGSVLWIAIDHRRRADDSPRELDVHVDSQAQ